MEQVIQEIVAIDIVNVAIISVSPVFRPRIDEHKGIATIFKARLTVHDHRTLRPERMVSPKLCAKPIIGDAATPAGRPRVLLLLAGFLPTRFLPACFWPARFWLRRPCFLPRRLFPLSLFLRMFLPVRSCRLGLILPRRLHFVLPGFGPGFPTRLRLLPGFFLSGFVFLGFFVLCVKDRGTRDQSRKDSKIHKSECSHHILLSGIDGLRAGELTSIEQFAERLLSDAPTPASRLPVFSVDVGRTGR